MATLDQKIEAERGAREMLEQGDLPQPDWVEYGYTCIRLIWLEPKVVLIVEIDEPPEGFEPVGEYLTDLGDDDEDDLEGLRDLITRDGLEEDDEGEEAA
jgi:hypothetical protein